MINANDVKQWASELGSDLCGIASIDRFSDAPNGFHPADLLNGCKSVIVIALKFPISVLASSSQAAYTFVHNRLVANMDSITFQLASKMESLDLCAIPIPATEPYEDWDDGRRHGQGILSLKHAAVQAGLGKLGKNTLLVNKQLGNMLLLGAVISNKDFESDPLADYQICSAECRLCLNSCPVNALNGTSIEQRKCRSVCSKSSEGGGFVYACNLCRKLCPQHQGLR